MQATGKREPYDLAHGQALQFAEDAAREFGVGKDRKVSFDKKLAEKDIKGDAEKLKGEVASFDSAERKFMLKVGKKNDAKEIEVATNEQTDFAKGKEPSTFEELVVASAKLDVELANGIAVKVTSKK